MSLAAAEEEADEEGDDACQQATVETFETFVYFFWLKQVFCFCCRCGKPPSPSRSAPSSAQTTRVAQSSSMTRLSKPASWWRAMEIHWNGKTEHLLTTAKRTERSTCIESFPTNLKVTQKERRRRGKNVRKNAQKSRRANSSLGTIIKTVTQNLARWCRSTREKYHSARLCRGPESAQRSDSFARSTF